jgi:hypothetical protein
VWVFVVCGFFVVCGLFCVWFIYVWIIYVKIISVWIISVWISLVVVHILCYCLLVLVIEYTQHPNTVEGHGLTYKSSSNTVSIARYRTNEFGKLETRRVPKAQGTTAAKVGHRARRVRTVETGHGTGRVADARFVRGKWL